MILRTFPILLYLARKFDFFFVKVNAVYSKFYSANKKKSNIRKEGNIARLSSGDGDDENNTWNGNSTQQM